MSFKDRCGDAVLELAKINRDMEQGVLNLAHIKRWNAQVDYLMAFVQSEIGRTASHTPDETKSLILYFSNEADREEMIAAVQAEKPNLRPRKIP